MNTTEPQIQNAPDQDSAMPLLPTLYRLLTDLIPDRKQFFHELITMTTTPQPVSVTAWHMDEPFITFREEPNPLGPGDGRDDKKDRDDQQQNMPTSTFHLSTKPERSDTEQSTKIEESVHHHFHAALVQRAIDLLEREGAHLIPSEHADWKSDRNIPTVISAVKCVFYASGSYEYQDALEEYIQDIQTNIARDIDKAYEKRPLELIESHENIRPFRENPDGTLTFQDKDWRNFPAIRAQYNKAAMFLSCTQRVQDANQGAMPWILAQPEQDETYPHEGQFIGAERALALKYGMSPRGWTYMTQMEPSLTRGLLNDTKTAKKSAELINWLASLSYEINQTHFQLILQKEDVMAQLLKTPQTLIEENLKAVALLAIHHPKKGNSHDTNTNQKIADAVTYARHMTINGEKITSRTWNGLLKKIHRWHEEMSLQATRDEWARIVQTNEGKVRYWEPVLGEFQRDGITARELTDEEMLLEEALQMKHCVHLYGAKSERGLARIFALTSESGNRATAGLVQTGGEWKKEQTRGYRNHNPAQEMIDFTKELVAACNSGPEDARGDPGPGE